MLEGLDNVCGIKGQCMRRDRIQIFVMFGMSMIFWCIDGNWEWCRTKVHYWTTGKSRVRHNDIPPSHQGSPQTWNEINLGLCRALASVTANLDSSGDPQRSDTISQHRWLKFVHSDLSAIFCYSYIQWQWVVSRQPLLPISPSSRDIERIYHTFTLW